MHDTIKRTIQRSLLSALVFSATWSANSLARGADSSQADLIQRVLPAVVTIFVRKAPAPGSRGGSAAEARDAVPNYSNGAGFVVDPDGLIVTNRHNVRDASRLVVGFSDGTYALASVVGAAEKVDLAVIRVNIGHKLSALTFAKSENVRVGDPVLAIGNPLGVGTSVSAGIVSALNRDINDSAYDDFIQTDAAINHGNSGGPLINGSGQVIGMNSDIFSSSGGSIGLGFALSSNNVKFLTDRLVRYGRVKAGWIGVDLQDLRPVIAFSLHEPKMEGAVVTAVTQGSPARAAGITEGDIIQRIGDVTPKDARDAERVLAYLPVGSTTHLTIWRDGREVSADVRLAELPGSETAENPAPLFNQFTTSGLKLAPLTDLVRRNNHMAPGQPGVLVTEVPNDIFTGKSVLLPGDVVLRVQLTVVASPEEAEHCIVQAKNAGMPSVVLLIQRKTGRMWVPLLTGDLTPEQQAELATKPADFMK